MVQFELDSYLIFLKTKQRKLHIQKHPTVVTETVCQMFAAVSVHFFHQLLTIKTTCSYIYITGIQSCVNKSCTGTLLHKTSA